MRNVLFAQYGWHLIQTESVQGGIELLVAFLLMAAAARWPRVFLPTVGIISAVYLQLHLTLGVAITSWALVEAVLWIGQAFRPRSREETWPRAASYGRDFVAGLAVWGAAAFAISLAGFGKPRDLILLTLALVLAATLRRPGKPLLLWVSSRTGYLSTAEKVLLAFVSTMLLMQFAKTVDAIDYDSIWYGLRPQYVLYGDHSLFDQLGYAYFVYYYPKLFELLSLPQSALGDYAFISGVNVALLALLVCITYGLSRQLRLTRFDALLVSASIVSIPAVANMASTAKPDILATLLVVAGAAALLAWVVKRKPIDLSLGVGALLLSFAVKLTSLVFVPPLLLGVLLAWWFGKRFMGASPGVSRSALLVVPALATLVVAFSYLRTALLTGYPVVPILGRLWHALGFRLRYPFPDALREAFAVAALSERGLAAHWARLLFAPAGYVHWIMVWPGNLAAFGLLATGVTWLIARRRDLTLPRIGIAALLMVSPVLAAAVFFGSTLHHGGDGNYYQIPLVLSITGTLGFTLRAIPRKALLRSAVLLFIPVQASVTLVSHFSWKYGTQPLNLDFRRTLAAERRQLSEDEFNRYGIASIATYLEEHNTTRSRCIGSTVSGSGREEEALYKLPCGYEDIKHVALQAPDVVSDPEALATYLDWARVRFLIVPVDSQTAPSAFRTIAEALQRHSQATSRADVGYTLFDLGMAPRAMVRLALDAGPRSELSSDLEAEPEVLTAVPNPAMGDAKGYAVVTLRWQVEPERSVEVRIGSPGGALFASSVGPSTATTGPWVVNGMVFYLQDVTGQVPLTREHTLGILRIRVAPSSSP